MHYCYLSDAFVPIIFKINNKVCVVHQNNYSDDENLSAGCLIMLACSDQQIRKAEFRN